MADIIRAIKEPLSEDEIAAICHGTLDALVFLHSRGFAHRNVNGSAIYLTNRGDVKLGEFGHAKFAFEIMAKECRKEMASDIWSVGAFCIELAGNGLLGFEESIISRDTVTQERLERTWVHWSPEFRDFVASLLVSDVHARPSATEALRMKFLYPRCFPRLSRLVEQSRAVLQQKTERIASTQGSTADRRGGHKRPNDEINPDPHQPVVTNPATKRQRSPETTVCLEEDISVLEKSARESRGDVELANGEASLAQTQGSSDAHASNKPAQVRWKSSGSVQYAIYNCRGHEAMLNESPYLWKRAGQLLAQLERDRAANQFKSYFDVLNLWLDKRRWDLRDFCDLEPLRLMMCNSHLPYELVKNYQAYGDMIMKEDEDVDTD